MPLQKLVAMVALVIAVGGCASPMKPLEFPPSVALQDPLPGQALVYLIRAPHDQLGIAVYANGMLVAALPHGIYTAIGLHEAQGLLVISKVVLPEKSAP